MVEDEKILFVEYKIDGATYYSLPGGSVEKGESSKQCVIREFIEETGIEIIVEKLILVNEFINPNPKFVADSWKNGIHQIETIFLVNRKSNSQNNSEEKNYDFGMQGIKWLSKNELKFVKYYPEMDADWFFSPKDFESIYIVKNGE